MFSLGFRLDKFHDAHAEFVGIFLRFIVGFQHADQPQVDVEFNDGPGAVVLQVEVTDDKGNSEIRAMTVSVSQ